MPKANVPINVTEMDVLKLHLASLELEASSIDVVLHLEGDEGERMNVKGRQEVGMCHQ